MAAIAVPGRRTLGVVPGLLRGASKARRYPLLPLAVLMLLLVIPAIFADLIAPHDHRIGNLDDVKLPPFWVGPDASVKEVVDRKTGGREERQGQILLSDAQRRMEIGDATVVGGSPNQEVSVGDEVEIVSQRGGSTKYLLGTDKHGRDILSRIIHGARVSLTVSLLAVFLGRRHRDHPRSDCRLLWRHLGWLNHASGRPYVGFSKHPAGFGDGGSYRVRLQHSDYSHSGAPMVTLCPCGARGGFGHQTK